MPRLSLNVHSNFFSLVRMGSGKLLGITEGGCGLWNQLLSCSHSSQTSGRSEAVGFEEVGGESCWVSEWIFGEWKDTIIQIMKEEPAFTA